MAAGSGARSATARRRSRASAASSKRPLRRAWTGPKEGGEEEGEGGADNRASLFIRQRAYPLDSIPFGARLEAYQQALKLLASAERMHPKLATWERWENIGPAPMRDSQIGSAQINVSGRVTALIVDPRDSNTAYAGAALGGVWKTTNGGQSWTPLTDQQASLATGDMALDPTDPDILYVGTGEPHGSDSYYGAGLLKSTDAGQSWALLGASEFAWAGISRVIVDPSNPQTLYVATANYTGVYVTPPRRPWAGVWKSTNGGQNWVRLLGCDYNNGECRGATDLVMDTRDSQVLYAAFWGVGIYKTEDGGARWVQVDKAGSDVNRIELAISPSNPKVLYAGYSIVSAAYRGITMIKSVDGGGHWVQLPRAPNYCGAQCNYDNIIVVHPLDENRVYVGGSANYLWEPTSRIKQVLQMSPDGGVTWVDLSPGDRPERTLHPDMHAIVFDPRNPDNLWVGNDGGVRRSTNGGQTWLDANGNLATLQFTGVAAHPTDPKIAFGGMQDNNKAKTTGAIVWQALDAGDGGFAVIDPFDARYYYGARFYLQFQRNDKSGSASPDEWPVKVWGINSQDRMLFYSPFAACPSTPGVLYWGTHRLYKTTDRGDHWQCISGDLTKGWAISAIAVAPSAATTIYVGTADGNVQVTRNGGGSWSNVAKLPLPNRFVSDIAVKPGEPQTAYVVYNGFSEHTPGVPGHVFKTTDGGDSWQNISANLPDVPVLALALDRDVPGMLYIGTDVGVFRSRNDGGSWELFNNGLANCAVTDLALNPDTNVLLAATHGRSVYRLQLNASPSIHLIRLPLSLKGFAALPPPPKGTPTRTPTPVFSLPTPSVTVHPDPSPVVTPPLPLSGNVITFVDGFSNPQSGWYTGTFGSSVYGYVNGEYAITTSGENMVGWSSAPSAYHRDGVFQVRARRQSSGAVYGLMLGGNDYNYAYYAFFINPDNGKYALMLNDGWEWSTLKDWTSAAAIRTGTNSNLLKVVRSGGNLALYVNDQLLANVAESAAQAEAGLVGVINWSLVAAATSYFDDFTIGSAVQKVADDNFSNPASGWATGTTEDNSCGVAYLNGEYAFTTAADSACYSIAPIQSYPFGIYEVSARRATSTYPTAYGLMFSVDGVPPTSYYLFWLNPDSSTFCLLGFDGIDLYALVDWTPSQAINPGTASNRLRVVSDGAQIHLYVNGIYLTTFVSDALAGSGYVGVINWASPYEPITSYFDDFRVYSWEGGYAEAAQGKSQAGFSGPAPKPVGPFAAKQMPGKAGLSKVGSQQMK